MRTILIVDDNAIFRALINHLLVKDFKLIEASDGTTALRIARKMHPNLILLDISMPGEFDGMDVLDLLKEDVATAYIPIIIMTANELMSASTCLRRGAADYLIKPFDQTGLLTAVATALNTECAKQN
jgi:CheY-like chemotaxis protein